MLPILRYNWSHCRKNLNNNIVNQSLWWHGPHNLSQCFMTLNTAWPHHQSWPSFTLINLSYSRHIVVKKVWDGFRCNLILINNLITPQRSWKTQGLVCSTCHPITLVFNLYHLSPGTALILNANIIPSLVKPPVVDGALEKIAHISGASIFGGSATVQIWKKS